MMQLKGNKIFKVFAGTGFIFLFSILAASCTKEVPKELLTDNDPHMKEQQEMPDDDIHKNIRQGFDHSLDSEQVNAQDEEKANLMMKKADDADKKFQKTKSPADKQDAVELHMAAANFMMLEANLPSKKKYRPAYKRFRRILELDPKNEEAAQNKQLIEDIYKQMGMEVPGEE